MSKKVGVVLSGCGVFDGSEIHEAVLSLLALDRQGVEILCMAPNIDQMHVMNHLTQQPTEERRNVLVESARIARGDIQDVKNVTAADVDALMFPGGFGAAKNLCTCATQGPDCDVNPEVERLIKEVLAAQKPIAAVCIAPALLAKVTGMQGLKARVTIGTDEGTAGAIERMGAQHVACQTTDVVVDKDNKIVTGPAYMLATRMSEVADGIERVVQELMALLPA